MRRLESASKLNRSHEQRRPKLDDVRLLYRAPSTSPRIRYSKAVSPGSRVALLVQAFQPYPRKHLLPRSGAEMGMLTQSRRWRGLAMMARVVGQPRRAALHVRSTAPRPAREAAGLV